MGEQIKEINVEEIMSEIKETIKERGYTEKNLTFAQFADDYKVSHCAGELPDSYDELSFGDNLRHLDCTREIVPWKVLKGNKLKVFIQKVIRKCIRFYVDPIVEEQNRNNYMITNLIAQLEFSNKEHRTEINKLNSRINELERELETIKRD